MCGRYANAKSAADLSRLFDAEDDTDGALAPDYNLAPTDSAPIVRVSASRGAKVVNVARWGLLPPWADNPRAGAKMINARAETIATSRAFAPSFAGKRCLVPADGWYEWVKLENGKQPYFMTYQEGVVFAGLWTASKFGLSCTIVTTDAIDDLARVHDRMPLLLESDRWDEWLTAEATPELLRPPSSLFVAKLEIRPVGAAIGDVRNDGPQLVERLDPSDIQESLF